MDGPNSAGGSSASWDIERESPRRAYRDDNSHAWPKREPAPSDDNAGVRDSLPIREHTGTEQDPIPLDNDSDGGDGVRDDSSRSGGHSGPNSDEESFREYMRKRKRESREHPAQTGPRSLRDAAQQLQASASSMLDAKSDGSGNDNFALRRGFPSESQRRDYLTGMRGSTSRMQNDLGPAERLRQASSSSESASAQSTRSDGGEDLVILGSNTPSASQPESITRVPDRAIGPDRRDSNVQLSAIRNDQQPPARTSSWKMRNPNHDGQASTNTYGRSGDRMAVRDRQGPFSSVRPGFCENLSGRRSNPDALLSGSSRRYQGQSREEVVVPRWQPDAEVTYCPICRTQFSFFVRKHHCR